jgi:hypothetical protein
MLKPGQLLHHPVHFYTAMLYGCEVSVWQEGEAIENGGIIEKYSDETIKINGAYFLKANCQFTVKGQHLGGERS